MRVLVTGATGFIGRWVSRALTEAGHEVRGLSRQARQGPLRVPFELVAGDISSPHDLDRAARGVSAIVHCAGSVSLRSRDRLLLERVNVVGGENLLGVARARSLRVIFTSSTATIGPTREPRVLDETSPALRLGFDSPYVETKRRAEAIALSYARDGLDLVVVNPGVALGPDDFGATSTELVLRYLTGELRFHLRGGASFCDVRDAARAYVAALERGRSGERYVLAGINRTHAELQDELCRLSGLGRSSPVPTALVDWLAAVSEASAGVLRHPFERFNPALVRWGSLFNYCSAEKAQRELGYRPRPFEETLRDTVVDHLRHGRVVAHTAKLRALLERAEHQ